MAVSCPVTIANMSIGLCASVDIYCERTSWVIDAEPVNAFSNLAFFIAAAFSFLLWFRRQNPQNDVLILALIANMVVIGIGSAIFHTVATRWAQWADVIPILVFILLYLWLVLTRFFDWSAGVTFVALGAFLAVTLFLETSVPVEFLWGGAMYLPTLVAIVALGAAMLQRWPLAGNKMVAAACVFVVAFFLRSLDMPACAAFPLGTHFLWHILNGFLLFLLLRLVILHAPRRVLPNWGGA